MDHAPPPKLRNGQPYEGIKTYAGQGVKRSCGKCGMHVLPATLRKHGPYGMCCEACRDRKGRGA